VPILLISRSVGKKFANFPFHEISMGKFFPRNNT
jgi:hypothetical protein